MRISYCLIVIFGRKLPNIADIGEFILVSVFIRKGFYVRISDCFYLIFIRKLPNNSDIGGVNLNLVL
jgi:hypothetical protein